jgi:hypothetical protein
MTKLLTLISALGVFVASAAYAMPVAPLSEPQGSLTIQVGYGCGLGVRRGPLYDCAPVYGGYDPYYHTYVRGYYRGYRRGYRRGYYAGRYDAYYPYVRHLPGDVVYVDRGFCGFGSYLSCSYGTCWRFCY